MGLALVKSQRVSNTEHICIMTCLLSEDESLASGEDKGERERKREMFLMGDISARENWNKMVKILTHYHIFNFYILYLFIFFTLFYCLLAKRYL